MNSLAVFSINMTHLQSKHQESNQYKVIQLVCKLFYSITRFFTYHPITIKLN